MRPNIYKSRREALSHAHPGAIFLLPSNQLILRNRDVVYPFRQESNFYYLTGLDEPNSFLALVPSYSEGGATHRSILFVEPKDPEVEQWMGSRLGVEAAGELVGADEAYPIQELERQLSGYLQYSHKIFYEFGARRTGWNFVLSQIEGLRDFSRGSRPNLQLLDPEEAIGELRIKKSEEEIEAIRKSCDLSVQAHLAAMKTVRPGMYEYEVAALLEYEMARAGCQRLGYGSVVAGGTNACIFHYQKNRSPLQSGQMLLVDAGGELNYYTADITRTYPIDSKFSEPQREIYELVYQAHLAAVAAVRPGATLLNIRKAAFDVLAEGILSLGLRKGDRDSLRKSGTMNYLSPILTSHYLGMEVHDAGQGGKDGRPRELEPGMVITVEPGLYLRENDTELPNKYRGMAVRIEDDILVTESGSENLSEALPKSREEIEAIRNSRGK